MAGTKSEHKGYRNLLQDTAPARARRICTKDGTEYLRGRACPTCKPPRVVENDEFIAKLQRDFRALERRAIDDPAMLSQIIMLVQTLAEIPNVVMAVSSDSHKADPMSAPSMREIMNLLGLSSPGSAHQRLKIGERIIEDRLETAGLELFAAAKRERAAREAAAQHAAEKMPQWTARRAHLRVVA